MADLSGSRSLEVALGVVFFALAAAMSGAQYAHRRLSYHCRKPGEPWLG